MKTSCSLGIEHRDFQLYGWGFTGPRSIRLSWTEQTPVKFKAVAWILTMVTFYEVIYYNPDAPCVVYLLAKMGDFVRANLGKYSSTMVRIWVKYKWQEIMLRIGGLEKGISEIPSHTDRTKTGGTHQISVHVGSNMFPNQYSACSIMRPRHQKSRIEAVFGHPQRETSWSRGPRKHSQRNILCKVLFRLND